MKKRNKRKTNTPPANYKFPKLIKNNNCESRRTI